jgi:hypothetical protein
MTYVAEEEGSEMMAARAEGLDPDGPDVVTAIDFVGLELSTLG